jgi:HTH-type transcriptional regulator, transcriptional repressor of NAD biosynthesis genes
VARRAAAGPGGGVIGHGLVLGKFLPPHAGHHGLVDHALERCERVTVAVLGSTGQDIPLAARAAWMAERHPRARIVAGIDDHPIDFADPAVHELHAQVIRELVPEPVDAFFSGEDYGDRFARTLGCTHVKLDRRVHRPGLSATAVRADPAAHWDAITPPVRAYLARRVAVVGAESTGTTTLAAALAEHYGTRWVPEVGRAVSEQRAAAGTFGDWSDADFVAIARRQQAEEDAAARASGPILICDTDALATCLWQERYLGRSTTAVEAIARGRSYALYVLTLDDVPFIQDGLRDGEHLRGWMTERFRERLAERPEPVVEVSGTHEERLAAALAAIDALLFVPG